MESNSSCIMDNLEILAHETCKTGSETKFWQSSIILLDNPHTINRRIAVSTELLICEFDCKLEQVLSVIRELDLSQIIDWTNEVDIPKKLEDLLIFRKCEVSLLQLQSNKTYLRIAKLLSRDKTKFATTLEIAIIDRPNNRLTYFYEVVEKNKRSLGTDFLWSLNWDNEFKLTLYCEKSVTNSAWLKEHLFPKFIKWMTNNAQHSFVQGSLNLVESEKYVAKYDDLKSKYANEMIQIWPENTDPLKFVYEDVAIATYLLLLWQNERETNESNNQLQSFVDLGCGNGLLVHILNSEGHPGFGIDLRKRKIWDTFPTSTKLEIRTIIPSSANLFPEADWIIGNHSDELTPWIPVIASRSSYRCRFFLLPCCAYEFDGSKYQRVNSSLSQYHEYMNYVRSISEACGFQTHVDKLRIPSTKRICFVGSNRTYQQEMHSDQEIKIKSMIHSKSTGQSVQSWSPHFTPREVEEKVRNCTQIDKDLSASIIKRIFNGILREKNTLKINDKYWNIGGTIEIKDAVDLIDNWQLKQLKSECGGLQTLLKNNSHIFRTAKGEIRLRSPLENNLLSEKNKQKKLLARKSKKCWFYENHPDGCPLLEEKCNFRHD